MTEQTQSTELATLPPADRAAIALSSSKIEGQLRELVQETANIQSVIDPSGREQAHRAGMKLKNTRVAIEKTGKTARDDAQAFSKAVIAEEKRLIGMIEPEERRVLSIRDAYDAKVAAEKAEKERIERERVNAIRTKIDAIRQIPATMAGEPAHEIAAEAGALQAFLPDGSFGEFMEEAAEAAATACEALIQLHQRVLAQEQEAARLAAERAELERQRQEREAEEARLKAEREKFEDERRAFMMEQAQARRTLFGGEQWTEEERKEIAKQGIRPGVFNTIPAVGIIGVDLASEPDQTVFHGIDIDRAHTAAEQVATDIAALASVSSDPDAVVEACLAASPEPNDDAAVQHFRDIVQELLNTRRADEIRFMLEEELAKAGLSQWRAA
ncbi:MAG TPA: hypothetical protein VJ652_15230 [Noviherbaspirillum sp.]|nr:hypothetical protein [Noviherbaspirillum sp.]